MIVFLTSSPTGPFAGENRRIVHGLDRLNGFADRLESFWLEQNLLGLDYGPEELAALAEDVTRADVMKAAAGIACDAVYFLSGGREEEDEEN